MLLARPRLQGREKHAENQQGLLGAQIATQHRKGREALKPDKKEEMEGSGGLGVSVEKEFRGRSEKA